MRVYYDYVKRREAKIPAVNSWEGFTTTGLNQRHSTHKHIAQKKEYVPGSSSFQSPNRGLYVLFKMQI